MMSQQWALLSPYMSPQNIPMANYQARDGGCFSGKEVPHKKQMQIVTFC